ncbi:MAG: threonylcarbamoyl-AMP synthase [Gammaproteobacteria bacterium]|nr:MAG: threonylcarbamoyl-AMP synthase [Gammaproteobacteria bacterium]RLA12422.1 MAG: threonylcarbamoyl-AMP synthase [Gammaproteobacteria bacterium]RLA12759.1 MAG: threonylcarbamoyl-AMP synthase [Gammaproteobacteria bacterium]
MSQVDRSHQIDHAVALLRAGELIGLPTETVYGLAADANNALAVKQIFLLKGRPADHPVIVHIADSDSLSDWAQIDTDQVWRLAEAFWPGPMTLVLPKQPEVDAGITAGQQTVAVRVPSHPVAQQVLHQFGGGVAAPSANRFGRISPTRAEHVRDEFGESIKLVLDGGGCEIGLESTILSLIEGPELLRPGSISKQQLETVLEEPVSFSNRLSQRAPGLLDRHYAPRTPAWLIAADDIAAQLVASDVTQKRVGLVQFSEIDFECTMVERLACAPAGYSQQLYAALRRLDSAGLDLIIVERPPVTPAWLAVNDRLSRATRPVV